MHKSEYKLDNNLIKVIKTLIEETNKNDKITRENLDYINSLKALDETQTQELLNILIKQLIIKGQNINSLELLLLQKLKNEIKLSIYNKINQIFCNKSINKNQKTSINYQFLQELLIKKDFQEADKLTQIHLCELAQLRTQNIKKWLYFTDISSIPSYDIIIIDLLWYIYSNEKFGFYIQRHIWLINNKNWDNFLKKIGWTEKAIMKRYPDEFIWNINAPKGHLPLFNQLRGVQVLAHLFKHKVWQEYFL